MADVDIEEPLSGISDSSFIILERGSLPNSITHESADEKSLDKNQNTFIFFESNKSQSKRNTPNRSFEGQSFYEEDCQEKLKQLMRENLQLKETLSQNNLSIKSQLDTFYMWQKEVLKTHETHRKMFLEIKDFILKLRTENSNLKKQLQEAVSTNGDDKSVTQTNTNVNEDLAKKNEVLEKENMDLKQKLKDTEKEILKLSSDLENASRESAFLKQRNDELLKNSVGSVSHGSLPNSDARAQISNLFKQLELERNKTSKLRENLKKANEIMSKAQDLNVLEEVDEYIKNLDDLDLSLSCQNERCSLLKSWVTLTEENIKSENSNLLGEIKELMCHISQEEKTSKEKQESVQELKDQFSRLLTDYKTLQEQLNSIENTKSVCEKYKKEVDDLSQKLEDKEKELLLKERECDNLKEEMKKLTNGEMEFLKIQLEEYKNDFEKERSDRENLATEKEQMAERVRFLESKLETSKKGQNEGKVSQENKNPYRCPICLISFSSLKNCEEHVDDCVQNHFYP